MTACRPHRRWATFVVALLLVTSCSSGAKSKAENSVDTLSARGAPTSVPIAADIPELGTDGWTTTTRDALVRMIAADAGRNKLAVFDFDNTTQARDVGESMLGFAQANNMIDPATLPESLYPPIATAHGTVHITDGIQNWYEALVESGGSTDPFREYASLPYIALFFEGRTISDFVDVTAGMYANGAGAKELQTGTMETFGTTGRAFIYPQMADLYGNLRMHGYDVWVVSAGITWAVRWMVKNALNPLIEAKYGAAAKLPLDHVIAVNPLMLDTATGRLVSDYQLVRSEPDQAYIDLDPARLRQLKILSIPDGLASWRGGKTGVIDNLLTYGDVYLAAGDSFGDNEMLHRARNRLIIARMNNPKLLAGLNEQIEASPDDHWMLQPTISTAPVGFLHDRCVMAAKTAGDPQMAAKTDESTEILTSSGRLGSFLDC